MSEAYPISNTNGCDTLVTGVTCPLKANVPVKWNHSIIMPPFVPGEGVSDTEMLLGSFL